MQAAVLLQKLKILDWEIGERQKIAERYNSSFYDKFSIPCVRENCVSSYAQYVLLADNRESRGKIIERLNFKKIANMVYYPTPMHRLKVFAGLNCYEEQFENAESYCSRTFSLPMHPYLKPDEQDLIIAVVIDGGN